MQKQQDQYEQILGAAGAIAGTSIYYLRRYGRKTLIAMVERFNGVCNSKQQKPTLAQKGLWVLVNDIKV